jgi:hypothetical protein
VLSKQVTRVTHRIDSILLLIVIERIAALIVVVVRINVKAEIAYFTILHLQRSGILIAYIQDTNSSHLLEIHLYASTSVTCHSHHFDTV